MAHSGIQLVTSIGRKGETTSENVFRTLRKSRLSHTDPRGTLVTLRTRNRRKVVWDPHVQARRSVQPLSRNDDAYSRRRRTFRISSNKCFGPRILEKQERWKVITSTVTCRMQSWCFAQSFPSTSSVSTEQLRIGLEKWLSKSLIVHFPAQGNL